MESYLKFVIIFAVSICNVQSDVIEITQGDSKTISCPPGQEILVDSSQESWKFFDNIARTLPMDCLLGECSYDRTETLKNLCDGLGVCVIKPSSGLFQGFGDYKNFLRVWYWCSTCRPTRRRRQVQSYTYVQGHGYLLTGGSCDLTARLQSNFYGCPNDRFTAKHVCYNPNHCVDTPLSASMFAMQVANIRNYGATAPTTFNSVFIATNMVYNQNGDDCYFSQRAPKYNCNLNAATRLWDCNRIGNIIATHSANNGHYDHSRDY